MPAYLTGNQIKKEPNLLFDKFDSSATHYQVYWGLRKYGPYDKKISKIRLAIISPKSEIKRVRQLINELNRGTTIMPGGMPRFFRCSIEIIEETELDSSSISSYEKGCFKFVNRFEPKDVDVILVYIPKTGRYYLNTPYYRTKAILASQGYSSQMITSFTFDNLKWSYLNLASAIFSKAGGIPWVLESEMKNVDILLGISISNIISKRNRAGNVKRYVGYVNVFDSYGKWMFFEGTAKSYEKGKKVEQLQELLSKALQKFEAEKNFLPKRVVIHYYKKWGKQEIDAVINILGGLLGEGFEVGFVSINDSHPFRIYDINVNDGSLPRGHYVYLSENRILMSTTGYTPIATIRMGTPKLLDIKLTTRSSNFLTIDDVALQVLSLTKLDWATATPLVREPITLQFSKEIAYLTAAISQQEWESINKLEVSATLNKRPWFI